MRTSAPSWQATLAVAAAVAGLSLPAASQACGACDQDRIAATYDHSVVERAAARGRQIVYCSLDGPFDASRVKGSVQRLKGVEARSVRVSAQPGALSFAVDPSVRSATATVDDVRRSLPAGATLRVVKAD